MQLEFLNHEVFFSFTLLKDLKT